MDGDILQFGRTGDDEPFDLQAIARLVSVATAPAAATRRVDLSVAVLAGAPAQLAGEVGRIGALVNALTLSAIDAAGGGSLALRLSAAAGADGHALLRAELAGRFIMDIGAAIAANRGANTEDPCGFGLDLARRVMAADGARLTFETAADGERRVALTIPVGLPAPTTDTERLTRWARARGGRLLVVDDSVTNRLVTAGLLSRVGFSVELATGGAEAVVAVANSTVPPEAVLMDVAMPEMDGVAATATIRALSGARGRVPIIAVTANAQPEDRSRCLAAGMNDYVRKPVRRADLLAALERWLAPA